MLYSITNADGFWWWLSKFIPVKYQTASWASGGPITVDKWWQWRANHWDHNETVIP